MLPTYVYAVSLLSLVLLRLVRQVFVFVITLVAILRAEPRQLAAVLRTLTVVWSSSAKL